MPPEALPEGVPRMGRPTFAPTENPTYPKAQNIQNAPLFAVGPDALPMVQGPDMTVPAPGGVNWGRPPINQGQI
jgi:hypothetical protein